MAPVISKQSHTVPESTFSLGTAYSQDWIVMAPGWSCWCTFPVAPAVTWNRVTGTSTTAATAASPAPRVFFFISAPFAEGRPCADATCLGAPCWRNVGERRTSPTPPVTAHTATHSFGHTTLLAPVESSGL